MKKIALLILLFATIFTDFVNAQTGDGYIRPSYKQELTIPCDVVDVDGKYYLCANVYIQSNNPDFIITKPKVKIIVKDDKENIVYKKTFKESYLYVGKEGIIVGTPEISRVVIKRGDSDYAQTCKIREKEIMW